jgi:hypothetical protein
MAGPSGTLIDPLDPHEIWPLVEEYSFTSPFFTNQFIGPFPSFTNFFSLLPRPSLPSLMLRVCPSFFPSTPICLCPLRTNLGSFRFFHCPYLPFPFFHHPHPAFTPPIAPICPSSSPTFPKSVLLLLSWMCLFPSPTSPTPPLDSRKKNSDVDHLPSSQICLL